MFVIVVKKRKQSDKNNSKVNKGAIYAVVIV